MTSSPLHVKEDVKTIIIDTMLENREHDKSDAHASLYELGQRTKAKLGCNLANAIIRCRDTMAAMKVDMAEESHVYTLSLMDRDVASRIRKSGTRKDRNALFRALERRIKALHVKSEAVRAFYPAKKRCGFVVEVRVRSNKLTSDWYLSMSEGKEIRSYKALKQYLGAD